MPDLTSIDLSSAKRREDEDKERLHDHAAANDAQARAALDVARTLRESRFPHAADDAGTTKGKYFCRFGATPSGDGRCEG